MVVSVENIKSPADIKELTVEQLTELANSCREKLIESVSETGGHFGPNLGVVELTVALHYVFDSPVDRLIWDVGHQAYIHKMLTGRANKLTTIRKSGGLSGFLKKAESEHDIFNAGHASTSISAASGVAAAKQNFPDIGQVVAIIGDGALTGGMAYEGLNNAGGERLDMTVVLNDNGMAIAENVGAITEYFDRLIHLPAYEQMKSEVKKILDRGPKRLGRKATALARRFEMSLKNLVIPRLMFEEFGFRYFGPVDGHDIPKLVAEFEKVKEYEGPRFVHVLTEKGHGYAPATEDQYANHAVRPFDIETGKPRETNRLPKWSRRVGQTLCSIGDQDDKVMVISAAMKKGTGTVPFAERFPQRFFDVGIAEQHAVTFAGGLASEGSKPFVCIYSSFLQRAYDQIFHDVCLMNLPVKFLLDRAGIVGGDGETHQGIFDLSYLRALPNMVIGAPATDRLLQSYIKTAAGYDQHPIAIRFPRATVSQEDASDFADLEILTPGEGKLVRQGSDLSIFAVGPILQEALKAAEQLAEEGIEVEVIDPRWVKPLDEKLLLQSVKKTGRLITLEEGISSGGFGGAVLELLSRHNIRVNSRVCGVDGGIVPHGERSEYLQKFGLTAEGIIETTRQVLTAAED